MKITLLSVLTTCLLATPLDETQDKAEEVNFQVLSNFDFEEGMELPTSVTKYHEKKVKVGGFMATEDGSDGEVEYFILVNDACGCEGTPMLNEMIFCAMPEGEKTTIKPGTVWVTGKLYVEEEIEEGVVVTLYTMEVDSVK
jgi:hypothetical protein